MMYGDAEEFRAYDILSNGKSLETSTTKTNHASNDVKSDDRPIVYTAVVKKPAVNGQVGFTVNAGDSDNVHQQEHRNQQQQQKKKKKKKEDKMMQMQPVAGNEMAERVNMCADITSMYPPLKQDLELEPEYANSGAGIGCLSPAAETAEGAEAGVNDSLHNITLIESAIYGNVLQVVDQSVNEKKASIADSEMSLTLVDNAMYSSNFNF